MGINILEGGRECRCHNGGSKQKRSCERHIHCAIEANEIAQTEREGLAGGMLRETIWAARMSVRVDGPQKGSAKVESIH